MFRTDTINLVNFVMLCNKFTHDILDILSQIVKK